MGFWCFCIGNDLCCSGVLLRKEVIWKLFAWLDFDWLHSLVIFCSYRLVKKTMCCVNETDSKYINSLVCTSRGHLMQIVCWSSLGYFTSCRFNRWRLLSSFMEVFQKVLRVHSRNWIWFYSTFASLNQAPTLCTAIVTCPDVFFTR